MQVDFGGGLHPRPGFQSLDRVPPCDILCDLAQEHIPLAANSVDAGVADNLLEHISPADIVHVMNELHRVMAPGGVLEVIVPNVAASTTKAFQDPTHQSYWVPEKFDYFAMSHDRWRNYGSGYGLLPWNVLHVKLDDWRIVVKMTPYKGA